MQFDAEVLRDSLIHASEGKISSGLFGVALACGLYILTRNRVNTLGRPWPS